MSISPGTRKKEKNPDVISECLVYTEAVRSQMSFFKLLPCNIAHTGLKSQTYLFHEKTYPHVAAAEKTLLNTLPQTIPGKMEWRLRQQGIVGKVGHNSTGEVQRSPWTGASYRRNTAAWISAYCKITTLQFEWLVPQSLMAFLAVASFKFPIAPVHSGNAVVHSEPRSTRFWKSHCVQHHLCSERGRKPVQ